MNRKVTITVSRSAYSWPLSDALMEEKTFVSPGNHAICCRRRSRPRLDRFGITDTHHKTCAAPIRRAPVGPARLQVPGAEDGRHVERGLVTVTSEQAATTLAGNTSPSMVSFSGSRVASACSSNCRSYDIGKQKHRAAEVWASPTSTSRPDGVLLVALAFGDDLADQAERKRATG